MTVLSRFSNKVVIVTGGGSGIGQAVVRRVVSEGGIVIAIDVNETGLKAGVKQTEKIAAAGGRYSFKVGSISDEETVKKIIQEVVDQEGRLDVLINVAGILRSSKFTETSLEEFMEPITVNLVGTFLTCREAMPHLIKTKGNIVNCASTSARFGHPYMAGYSASKGGVEAMTKALSWEYMKEGVRVNAVCPGGISTPMKESQGERMGGLDQSLFAHLMRIDYTCGEPDHVAAVFAMLASADGSFMTGEIVKVDGGVHN
ncbi:hypothetical protein EMPS_09976 [Entomortierella parvispora]|uniref:Ketoreductase domain-containing protein n=1 Tax=Entomortierella parvispora TaxID=205924 RepID=A0A9P3M0W3_9FUNG|nr:hypothetical protein EMPS_09976 [Entomortierella parvispora]